MLALLTNYLNVCEGMCLVVAYFNEFKIIGVCTFRIIHISDCNTITLLLYPFPYFISHFIHDF